MNEATIPYIMIISGLTFNPCALIAVIIVLFCFVVMAWFIDLLFVIVYSLSWIAMLGVGMNGPYYSCVTPCIYTILGHSHAKHVHFVVRHEHHRVHDGMV